MPPLSVHILHFSICNSHLTQLSIKNYNSSPRTAAENNDEGGDWSEVSKGKVVNTQTKEPAASKNTVNDASLSTPSSRSSSPATVAWSSLFETPRQSPLCRSTSPKPVFPSQQNAMNFISSAQPVVVSWRALQVACRMRTRGMHNIGNMCFLNAVLQSLLHCAPIANLFKSIPIELLEALHCPYLLSFSKLFHEYYLVEADEGKIQPHESLIPIELLDTLRHSGTSAFQGDQEDAQEFLSHILDQMHQEFIFNEELMRWKFSDSAAAMFASEEANEESGWMEVDKKQRTSETRAMNKKESPISFLFSGQFRSTVKRQRAKDSITFEPFNCLPLEVHQRSINSIEESLENLSKAELIDGGSLKKYVTIDRLPMILIVQMKRFIFSNGRIEKVSKHVAYPEKLVIPSATIGDNRSIDHASPTYRLVSVVYHHGMYAEGGHYTAHVRKSFSLQEDWQHINDGQIKPASMETVLSDKGGDMTAYLLFYQRTKDSKQ